MIHDAPSLRLTLGFAVFGFSLAALAPAQAQAPNTTPNAHMEIIHHPNYDKTVNMPFPPAIKIKSGKLLWLAGTTALPVYHDHPHKRDQIQQYMENDLEAQTRRAMDGIKQTLEASGASFKDVVHFFVFRARPRIGDIGKASAVNLNVGGSIATNAAKIELNGGGMATFDAASGTFVPIKSTMHAIAPSGTLTLAVRTFNWTDLTIAGTLILLPRPGAANPVFNAPSLVIDATGKLQGSGTVHAAITNNGLIRADALIIDGAVAGSGKFEIAAGGTLELNGATSQAVKFLGGGLLTLDNPASFAGSITPAAGPGDQVKLAGVSLNSVTGYHYSDNGAGGVLSVHTSSGDIQLNFSGHFSTQSFTLAAGDQPLSPSLLITEHGFVTVPAYPAVSGNVDEWILSNGRWEASAGPGSQSAGFRVATVADFTGDAHKRHPLAECEYRRRCCVEDVARRMGRQRRDRHASRLRLANRGRRRLQRRRHAATSSGSTRRPGRPTSGNSWTAIGQASVSPGNHPLGYQVVGIGDFNGDGTSDVLWFNPASRERR